MNTLSGTALGDYGATIFERDHFTCAYCGYDGRLFDNWMQLSVDHILPQSLGGASRPRQHNHSLQGLQLYLLAG